MMNQKRERSISQTFRQFGQKLNRFVRSRVSSLEDAEDILQDVWYQLSNLDDMSVLENAGAWLFRVARNRITDHSRKQSFPSIEEYRYEDEEGDFSIKELLWWDETQQPEMEFFREMFWDAFQQAIEELPENQREVFILNELEDVPLREIAVKQGVPLKTIISRKGYAVSSLRKKLLYLYNELTT